MTTIQTSTRGARRRIVALVGFALLCTALTAALALPPAGARKATIMGKTNHTPNPACPDSCTATGRVTGFMTVADGTKHPFNVFKDGKIVAWALDLSKPTKDQYNFFGTLLKNGTFGDHPSARLAVIKNKGRHKYKLVKQGPAMDLRHDLGRKQLFTLNKPLKVHKGQVVALTLPSWASNFAANVSTKANQWRASRTHGDCNVDQNHLHNAKVSKAQQKVGSVRPYGCQYKGARLLYWAYFVPSKKK